MKVYLASLGCKLNWAEIETFARELVARGHQVVSAPEEADWAIVNTCTVTHIAARKSRRLIRHLRRCNSRLRLAVVGCYAEVSPQEVKGLGADLVLGNLDKEKVVEKLLAFEGGEGVPLPHQGSHPVVRGRTRAFVKIQDGCDNRCTYCIVTIARGPSRSRRPEEVVAEIKERVAEGYQEIVLTGVNIGAYGRDKSSHGRVPLEEGWSLERLVRTILEQTSVPRLRLSSIEPWDLDPGMLALWEDSRLCRHLHLPLQSGSDTVLRRMGRKYSTAQYAALVEEVHRHIPGVGLTTDVIVGFPGETEEEFSQSLRFVQEMAFSRVHVFRYSRRAGTAAARMKDQVPPSVIQERSARMLALARRLARDFHQRFIGQELQVLFENLAGENTWQGLTDNYIRVEHPYDKSLINHRNCRKSLEL